MRFSERKRTSHRQLSLTPDLHLGPKALVLTKRTRKNVHSNGLTLKQMPTESGACVTMKRAEPTRLRPMRHAERQLICPQRPQHERRSLIQRGLMIRQST